MSKIVFGVSVVAATIWFFCSRKQVSSRYSTPLPPYSPPRVLITGVGRSGTTGLNRAFHSANFKTKHEQHGVEMSVGWVFARYQEYPLDDGFDNQWHNYNNRHYYERFDVNIQLVRHPLKTISSWTSLQRNPSRNYVVHMTPELTHDMSTVHMAMAHWYDWNSRIGEYADKRWNIETVDIQNECLLLWVGDIRCHSVRLEPSLRINTRKHKNYSWNDLKMIDEPLTLKIQTMCTRYGYSDCT